jgi:hypothetical protein
MGDLYDLVVPFSDCFLGCTFCVPWRWPGNVEGESDLTLAVTYTKGTVMDSDKTPATRLFLETGSSQIWIECNSATIKSLFWFSESLSIESIFLIQPFLTSGSNSMYST